jgi:hypothetical protein
MRTPGITLGGLLLLSSIVGCAQPMAGQQMAAPAAAAPQATAPQANPPTTENYKYRQEGGGGGSGY